MKAKYLVIIVILVLLISLYSVWNNDIQLIEPREIFVIEGTDFEPEDWLKLGVEISVTVGHKGNQLLLAINQSRAESVEIFYEDGYINVYVYENPLLEKKDRLFHTETLWIQPSKLKNARVYIDGRRVIFVKLFHAVE